jgi:hypothetical protein
LILIVYLVGVGVVLAPTVRDQWSQSTASEFSASLARSLPDALAWPAGVVRSVTGEGNMFARDQQPKSP